MERRPAPRGRPDQGMAVPRPAGAPRPADAPGRAPGGGPSGPVPDGRLVVRRDGARLTVVLAGAVDLAVRDRDAPRLWTALGDPGVRVVEVDAAAVTFLDSSGMSVLVRLARDCAERDLGLRLGTLSPRVGQLLEQTGVLDWMADVAAGAGR